MATALLALYLATLSVLALYGLHRVALLSRLRWARRIRRIAPPEGELPSVTVQLPLFNERTVAARLIRAVGALDYPPERLEIQVLDDSSDETRQIAEREVERLRERGVDARCLRRDGREGFKAGALAHGMEQARGELLCVFDADFAPPPRFLLDLVGAFGDPRVGMVQARWEHANRGRSLLTRAQSVLLDGHFVVEHQVRHASGLFFNFNGTAGIWRRVAIESSGGWQHDTLTEDLDLSYRAQLAGWRFVYAGGVTAAAEVPRDIAAFRSQQRRWARGSVQVARKLGPAIAAADVPWRVKLEAALHLTGNAGYPLVLALGLLLPAVAGAQRGMPGLLHLALFVLCTLSVALFYERGQRALGRPLGGRLIDSLAAIALGIGMSLDQTRAVLLGLSRRTGSFVRTPKWGDANEALSYRSALAGWPGAELAPAAWSLFGALRALERGQWGALPFLLLFALGFAWVGALSLSHALGERRSASMERPACELPSTPLASKPSRSTATAP